MATNTSRCSISEAVSQTRPSNDDGVACKNNGEQGTCKNEPKTDNWYLHRPKNKRVLGVWDEECSFQLSLRYRDRTEDPLAVRLFSEVMPYHCLPTCGVYGLTDYHIALPLMIVVLPSRGLTDTDLLCEVLPKQLQHCFAQEPVKDPNKLDVSILIHSRPYFEDSVDPSNREVNLLFHMWALKDLPSAGQEEVHMALDMGGFSPEGVVEIPPVCEAEELNGLPLGRTGPRILYMHDMCFSPHNAQVQLTQSHSLHVLYTLCKQHSGHRALTYHIIPSTQGMNSYVEIAIQSICPSPFLETSINNLSSHITSLTNPIRPLHMHYAGTPPILCTHLSFLLAFHSPSPSNEAEDKIKLAVKSSSKLDTFLKHFRTIEEQLLSSSNFSLTHGITNLLYLATKAL